MANTTLSSSLNFRMKLQNTRSRTIKTIFKPKGRYDDTFAGEDDVNFMQMIIG